MTSSDERLALDAIKLRGSLGLMGFDLLNPRNLSIEWRIQRYDPTTDTSLDVPAGFYEVRVDCSDTFWWGTEDFEAVTPETWPTFVATLGDLKAHYEQTRRTYEQALRVASEARTAAFAAYREAHPDRSERDHWDANGNPIHYTAPTIDEGAPHPNRLAPVLTDLYAARVRHERPQGACYAAYPRQLWPMFDAVGPEREVGIGNPYAPGTNR